MSEKTHFFLSRTGLISFTGRLARFLLLALVSISEISSYTGYSGAQSSNQAAPIAAPKPIFYLVRNINPVFDDLVKQHYPTIAALQSYSDIKRTSVVVVNTTNSKLLAMCLRWELIDARHNSTVVYTTEFIGHTSHRFVPGTPLLGPGQVALISPIAHAEENVDVTPEQRTARFAGPYSNPAIAKDVLSSNDTKVTLDAAIFSSGLEIGPDASGLAKRFNTERNASILEAQLLVAHVKDEPSLRSQLTADANMLTPADYSQPDDAARKESAQYLLAILQRRGLEAMSQTIRNASAFRVLNLRRRALPASPPALQ